MRRLVAAKPTADPAAYSRIVLFQPAASWWLSKIRYCSDEMFLSAKVWQLFLRLSSL